LNGRVGGSGIIPLDADEVRTLLVAPGGLEAGLLNSARSRPGRAAGSSVTPGFAVAQFLTRSVVVFKLEATMITYCSDGFRPIKHGEYGVDGPLAAAVAFAARHAIAPPPELLSDDRRQHARAGRALGLGDVTCERRSRFCEEDHRTKRQFEGQFASQIDLLNQGRQ
jgi:hypothetical protein